MKAGWQIKPLGEICDILDNLRKPITKSQRTDGIYPYYGATGILDYVEGFLFNEPLVLVGEDGAKWASGEHTAFPVSGKCWVNNHAHVIRPHRDKIVDTWLINYLVHSDLSEFVSGLTVPKLNQGNLREIPVPFPTIQEQLRIVAILDQAFNGIAKLRANAEQNLQNARALFASHLQSVFTQRGERWSEGIIEEYTDKSCSLSYGVVQPGDDYENGLPIVRPTDLSKKLITLKGLKLINPELASSYKRTQLLGDEILLCVRGETGTLSVTTPELKGANVTRGIVPIRFDKELIFQKFGYWIMKSPFVQAQIKSKTYGAALLQINIGDLRKINIAYPDLETQHSLAKTFDELDEKTQRLETLYQRKITCLDELKKSLLQQAFAGEL